MKQTQINIMHDIASYTAGLGQYKMYAMYINKNWCFYSKEDSFNRKSTLVATVTPEGKLFYSKGYNKDSFDYKAERIIEATQGLMILFNDLN